MFDPSKIKIRNCVDGNGKPAGGTATVVLAINGDAGLGYHSGVVNVEFQDGPIKDAKGRNGAFVEDLLYIAKVRLEFYNKQGFECDENNQAIESINAAMGWLQRRTDRRVAAGTEGTHEGK